MLAVVLADLMTATRITVNRTIMSGSRLIVDHSFCENSFIGRHELHDFSSRSVFYDNVVFFSNLIVR